MKPKALPVGRGGQSPNGRLSTLVSQAGIPLAGHALIFNFTTIPHSIRPYMFEQLTELLLEDEALTDGLSDEDAGELLAWLIGVAENLEAESGEIPQAYISQLKQFGREIARISRRYRVPVQELIDLVELAWEEPQETSAPKPMQA